MSNDMLTSATWPRDNDRSNNACVAAAVLSVLLAFAVNIVSST